MPKQIAVIGGGPAGLMAAEVAARGGAAVTVYERMPTVGRKFLLAGRGGLNLTHSEDLDAFLARYGAAAPRLRAAIDAFPPNALRAWCEELGQETFVGSSGRVFPRSMKTSPLLRAWLRRLDAAGVGFKLRHRWMGWDAEGRLLFDTPEGRTAISADATILALGGASWPHLGSDGAWVDTVSGAGVGVTPLRPANCGFLVDWSDVFRSRFAGHPLKRLELSFGSHKVRGEAMVTETGLGRRRHLCAVGADARGHRQVGRGASAHRSASRRHACRPGNASRRATRETIAVYVSAQGGEPVSSGNRVAAGSSHGVCAAPCSHGGRLRLPISSKPCRFV